MAIAVVGEAPGVQEAKHGRPFTGPSGRLLKMVLANQNIKVEDVFLTNTCLCRPPQNATPSAEAIKCCRPRLEEELNVQQQGIKTILALGNTAAQSILETKDGITKLRVGTGRTAKAYPGIRIIPTVHPAACLRQGDMFPSLVADIRKLANRATVTWEPPTFKVFDDERGALNVLGELLSSRYPHLVVDIEVGVDKDEFGHPERYDMLCIGISYAPGKAIVIGENACASDRVRTILRQLLDSKRIICHNGKFDLAGLRAYCSTGAVLWFDTMIASYCLDERPRIHDLGYCGTEYLGCPEWKWEIKKYVKSGESYALVPREVLYRYNAWDAAVTFLLFEYFSNELGREGLRGLHDFLVAASNELEYPERDGVLVDREYNDWLTEHYVEDLGKLDEVLADITEMPKFNPRSWQQVQKYLVSQGFHVPNTNIETLTNLHEAGHLPVFLSALMQQRKGQKLYGTYVKGIRKRLFRGRVHPTFLIHGTVTGRLSCRNPNLQNIPRDSVIRKQFVPAEGNVYLQGDYGQAELRVMATLSKDRYLHEVFNDPSRDLFNEVGQVLYGQRAIGHKELRIRTKAYVYGLSYGREEFSIAREYKVNVGEARRGMEAFLGLIPDLVAWRKDLMRRVLEEQEDLVTSFGRHRRFWLITDENKRDTLKEALSFYPQSTASDICLTALGRIRRGLGSRGAVRIPVHDSILAECAKDDADEVAVFMKHEMEQTAKDVFTDFVPFPVDVERGNSWGALSA